MINNNVSDAKLVSLVSQFLQKCEDVDAGAALEKKIVKSRALTIEGLIEKATAAVALDGIAYYEGIAASIVRDLIAMVGSAR